MMNEIRRINQSRLNNAQQRAIRDRVKLRDKYIHSSNHDKVDMLDALDERIVQMYRDYYAFVELPYT
jgi:hypothetical protein